MNLFLSLYFIYPHSNLAQFANPKPDILPRPCQDPVKGQEPPIWVLAISWLLLLPLNSLSFMTPEAS